MRKVKSSAVRQTTRKKSTAGTGRAVDMGAVRQRITNLVGSRAVDMVKASADDAQRKGNVAAMKFLFEMVGLFPAPVAAANEKTPGMAEILLDRLGTENETGRQ